MKQTSTNANRAGGGLFGKECRASCRKIRARIAGVKEAIFAESSRALPAPERLVRLALNEAEAVAWQTKYPHLVFPALATEKVQAVGAWNARQQSVRRNSPVIALAA
jgi:hypothetical protein